MRGSWAEVVTESVPTFSFLHGKSERTLFRAAILFLAVMARRFLPKILLPQSLVLGESLYVGRDRIQAWKPQVGGIGWGIDRRSVCMRWMC